MKNFLPLFLICIALNTFSQKEANFWYFGEGSGLDFSTNTPIFIGGKLETDEGSASISDKNGNLLFYTDGSTVYNKTDEIMSNGEFLLGNSSSAQSAIIVPKPSDSNIYYIFTVGNQTIAGGNGVAYSEVDLRLDNNLGGISRKNIFLNSSAREKITSVSGSGPTCDAFWVITSDENNFYVYKVDSSGVNTTPISFNHERNLINLRGYLKLSPDGKLLVNASANFGTYIYDFDSDSGIISNGRTISVPGDGYGVEFSRSSQKLYISTGVHSQINNDFNRNSPNRASIFQFDLTASNLNLSRIQIYTTNFGYRGALQLAPNGKIYYARSRQNSLGVINSPNESGMASDFVENGISLETNISTEGLPPFIQSFFSPVNIVDSSDNSITLSDKKQQLCIDEVLTIEPELPGNATSIYLWTKKDDPSVTVNTRVFTIDKTYGSGIYNLKMTILGDCGRTKEYNSSIEVQFNNLPSINDIDVYVQCDFDSNSTDFIANFNLENLETELYTEKNNATIAFFEINDTAFLNPVNKANYRNSVPATPANGNHKLMVRIINSDTGCQQTKEIELKVNTTSASVTYSDIYTCEIDENATISGSTNSLGSGNAFYNFDEKTQNIINSNPTKSFSQSTHNFNYYRTRLDAVLENKANEIVAPYNNYLFNNNDDIFIRISQKGSNTCENIGQFKFFVQKRPIPLGNSNEETILCLNNPVDKPQLRTVPLNADTGEPTDTYKWYLNGIEITGENNAILNANKKGVYKVEAIRVYVNNIADTADDLSCIGYNTFTVKESNLALIESIDLVDDQDFLEDNTLTIKIKGEGNYEYALNNNATTAFEKGEENLSYIFTNVKLGLNTVYIRDINGCGIVSSQEISFVYFQRHFSPNEDGEFDTWKVQGIDNPFYTVVDLQIFDRFGNLLKVINLKTESGWNGILNGKIMPSNDYWYNATLIDKNGKVRKKTGNFSLIRNQ